MKTFESGQYILVAIRNEYGEIDDIYGMIVISQIQDFVITCSSVIPEKSIKHILDYLVKNYQEDKEGQLFVFPVKDCYATIEECEKETGQKLYHGYVNTEFNWC